MEIRRGADKSLSFPIFLFAAQRKEIFLDGLKKLEQRSHKRVWRSWGNMWSQYIFFNPVACCFLYKAKALDTIGVVTLIMRVKIHLGLNVQCTIIFVQSEVKLK
jgi:hypothetical protein